MDSRAHIEELPHLAAKMSDLWCSRELDSFVNGVMMDTRDGTRRGLPPKVAQEMLFVSRLNSIVLTMKHASDVGGSDLDHPVCLARAIDAPERTTFLPWHDAPGRLAQPGGQIADIGHDPAHPATTAPHGEPVTTSYYLSLFLNERPPAPVAVRVALSEAAASGGRQISREFFRCISRELGSLGIEDLVLTESSGAAACPWLGDAVAFAKNVCHLSHVSFRTDLLALDEARINDAFAAGLDCLVLELDWASPAWRQRAEADLAQNPGGFESRLHRLLKRREDNHGHAHKCLIKVLQIGHVPAAHPLAAVIERLAEQSELFAIEKPPRGGATAGDEAGEALCWGPFTEGHIDVDGRLMACGHDRKGVSFVEDLKHTEFMHAWHGEAFRAKRRALLEGRRHACLCDQCPGKAMPAR